MNDQVKERAICLFDVDGTLTDPRCSISPEMRSTLDQLKERVTVGLVGGSDLPKIAEQMIPEQCEDRNAKLLADYEYVFSENGLKGYYNGELINNESFLNYFTEEKCQRLINFCLDYLSKITLPVKRGNFIEFRTGMINVSPIGRSCSQAERLAFAEYDKVYRVREQFVRALETEFPANYGLKYSIGGQISIDIFPIGWDKTYCLKFLNQFTTIYFFGDKTDPGGNDHELYMNPRVTGFKVISPDDTMQKLQELFSI